MSPAQVEGTANGVCNPAEQERAFRGLFNTRKYARSGYYCCTTIRLEVQKAGRQVYSMLRSQIEYRVQIPLVSLWIKEKVECPLKPSQLWTQP